MGQSNIAAGATIGSNHNSRAADGEIIAKRGFWPGLVTNFKHNSYFASFTLIAKGNYNAELNVTLPFSLISPGENLNTINIFPGYWFKHNMYALARNAWKFSKRDKRRNREQNIETDFLAPDTVEEMLFAINILQDAINQHLKSNYTLDELISNPELDKQIQLNLNSVLNKGNARVLKPVQALSLYRMMIFHYGAVEIIKALNPENLDNSVKNLKKNYKEPSHNWHNVGGQLIPEEDLFKIFDDLKSEIIKSWNEVHKTYQKLWTKYPEIRLYHGVYSLFRILDKSIEEFAFHWVIKNSSSYH